MNNINREKVRAGQPYLYRKGGLASEVYQVRFNDDVKHAAIDAALQHAIARYPYFRGRLLEENGDFFAVENDLPLRAVASDELVPLGGRENNYYLIGVNHSGRKVNVSFHHGLADGRGVKAFVETLIWEYCRLRYDSEAAPDGIRVAGQPIGDAECAEPCGKRYAVNRGEGGKIEGLSRKGFKLPETSEKDGVHRMAELRFSQDEFMAVCKRYGASPILLLSAMMSRAIKAVHPECAEIINSNFPVDVRTALGVDETYKNCVKSVSLPYGSTEEAMTTEALCAHYRELLDAQRKPAHCKREFNNIIMLLDAINLLPSYKGKQRVLRFLDDLTLDTYLISYVGQFNLGDNARYVDSIHLFSSCADGLVLNMTCAAGWFTIDFLQDFAGSAYLTALTEQFAQEGIAVQTTGLAEFSTPRDHLMRDMPRQEVERVPLERRLASAFTDVEQGVLAAYRATERGTVAAFTAISDSFVRRFLLRPGESVAEAKQRLAAEQAMRLALQPVICSTRSHNAA